VGPSRFPPPAQCRHPGDDQIPPRRAAVRLSDPTRGTLEKVTLAYRQEREEVDLTAAMITRGLLWMAQTDGEGQRIRFSNPEIDGSLAGRVRAVGVYQGRRAS
jgi:hypothetical protein